MKIQCSKMKTIKHQIMSGKTHTIMYYLLFLKTHVQANLYGMFRDEKLFPDNDSFTPERWLRESKMDPKLKSLSNLIWGHGARMCIGKTIDSQNRVMLYEHMLGVERILGRLRSA